MIEKEVVVENRSGIHTRPASLIVKTAAKYKSEIYIINEGFSINAKSIIGVMTLGAGQGTKLILSVEGKDENEAMEELYNLISSGFGEL